MAASDWPHPYLPATAPRSHRLYITVDTAMPLSASSFSLPSTLDRVEAWLQNTPPASPAPPTEHSRKRRRDADMSRNSSPKRQRVDADHVLPTQSASQVGSVSIVDLSDRTTFTAPQGFKRSLRPTRQLTELRTATPSICISPLNQVKPPPPADIAACISSLRSRLGCREGLETGYIPAGLREAIETDALFAPSLAMDPIDPEAFDYDDTRPASNPSLVDALVCVKNIFQDACHCTEFGRDENAWCYRVVWPLVKLAMKLRNNTEFKFESVQSQSIQPPYLSTIPEPTPASPNRRVALTPAKTPIVSHTSDNCTQRLGLFSGIEVKPENGDPKDAELQISIWMAASLRKKMELACLAFSGPGLPLERDDAADKEITATNKVVANVHPLHLLEPAITIIGNEHKVYYAYPSSLEGNVTVLGPDEKFAHLTTRSVQGIFKLVRFYGRILEWGFDREAITNMQGVGHWAGFLGPVLEKLGKGG
ncbi:ribonuclease h [Pyrenophora seminiperda CCB06]|uniref:Ribonuclease h n=1 Tax=Pyrenophora seminiperda CCB06 TaxID=1302712 RepID=A0A3M7M5J0_9PLEO|nr:ribonuclease h [Pyrenophora seminiperda CCB06]